MPTTRIIALGVAILAGACFDPSHIVALDAPGMCAANLDCIEPLTPVCGSDNVCRSCSNDAECDGAACLPTGACGSNIDVAYVDVAGVDNGQCTQTAKCKTVGHALSRQKPYIKVSGTHDGTITVTSGTVTILGGENTKLTRIGNGLIVSVSGTANLTLHNLRLADATGATVNGTAIRMPSPSSATLTLEHVQVMNNEGRAILVEAGELVVSRSTIENNIGGGIQILNGAAGFSITNSFIVKNGKASGSLQSAIGGLALFSTSATSRLEFNTIAFNSIGIGATAAAGVHCASQEISAGGNIIYGNMVGLTPFDGDQASGSCQFASSFVKAFVGGDLGFNVVAGNFHLSPSSPPSVRDVAGATCPPIDIDGDPRPLNGACDLGADEFVP